MRITALFAGLFVLAQPQSQLPGELGEAHFIAVGPKDEIYIADTGNSTLHKFVRK